MPISKQLEKYLANSSWIRKLFEEGQAMRLTSREPVYDLTIGNPDLEPPPKFKKILRELASDPTPGQHRYMSNVGYLQTRQALADSLNSDYGDGLSEAFSPEHVLMTVGAGGAINVALKVLLNPGDEVIVCAPHFVEYRFYIENHGGRIVMAGTRPDFDLDPTDIEQKLTDRTKVLLINNPNNPTGVVYPQKTLDEVGEVLRAHSKKRGEPIFLLDDAPYRKLVYDMPRCTSSLAAYENTLFASSHSKDLGIPGERIGFLAISPMCREWRRIAEGTAFANRSLGFVNAPAMMQRVVAHLQDETIDLDWYRTKRDRIVAQLTEAGYEMPYPGGAFYIFPKAPGGDDVAFIKKLKDERLLVVPGTGFGYAGYFRLAYCVNDNVLEGALPILEKAIKDY
jgi:aspartate aminotransferase